MARMGRPKSEAPKLNTLSMRVTDEELQELKEYADSHNIEAVNVVPQPKAGGSFAATCYKSFERPVAAEYVKADAGMDIGLTLIGMHLKHVAVPVRLSINKIGCANVVFARTRPKSIPILKLINTSIIRPITVVIPLLIIDENAFFQACFIASSLSSYKSFSWR